jgi:hypothetical protein
VTETIVPDAVDALQPFVGQWRMAAGFASNTADPPRAVTTFEWLSGRRFLIQRWEVEHPDAPDGIAIIGFDPDKNTLVQNYFDSRGVARLYDMAFDDTVWTLQRYASEPDFSQRFIGRFSNDNNVITGHWDRSSDGSTWLHDFDLSYTRVE